MKRYSVLFVFALIALVSNAQSDTILMTLGNNKVSKADFEYLFFKNRANLKAEPQTIDEYIDTYKKFKLKVIEAQSLGYDTVESFRNELNSYRNQIAIYYLTDKAKEEDLIEEAYKNMLEDVEMSHMLFRLPHNATPEDTLKVHKRAMEAIKRLKKESFSAVALDMSDDVRVAENKGKVGWLTGQMMPYPLEKAMYSLPVGQVSQPVRVDYGYHVIKITGRRPAVGRVQVAHILKKFPENATKEQKAAVKSQIDDIYKQIKQGGDFATLAIDKSDDKASANMGGVMKEFGVGRMVEAFENTAFGMKKNGEISEPIETPYGWHILQLIDKRPVDSFDKAKAEIINRFVYDGRWQASRKHFVDKLKVEYNYRFNQSAYQELLDYARKFATTDSNYLADTARYNKTLFTIKDKEISQNKFMKHLYSVSRSGIDNTVVQTQNLIDGFVDDEILRFEDTQLESKYPAFKYLLQEYHDGILLFNISNDKIWEKASTDTTGLRTFFKTNIKQYAWQTPHYKGKILACKDKKTAKILQKKFKKMSVHQINTYIASLNKDSVIIESKSGLWAKGTNPIIDNLAFNDKTATFVASKEFPYVFVWGKILDSLPEEYTDVRAAVVTDYQNYLEEEWVKDLEKKYPVTINEEVLKAVENKANM